MNGNPSSSRGPTGPMDAMRVVLCTCAERDALRLAHAVIEDGRAACVNILPGLTSVYRWEDEIREDRETLLLIKTTARATVGLTALIHELHPYAVPEVICLPIKRNEGNRAYLQWLIDSVTAAPERSQKG